MFIRGMHFYIAMAFYFLLERTFYFFNPKNSLILERI